MRIEPCQHGMRRRRAKRRVTAYQHGLRDENERHEHEPFSIIDEQFAS
jgi:hypothetical protein